MKMNCAKCGTEMVNTMGGNFYCPKCGSSINDLVDRSYCNIFPNTENNNGLNQNLGWICPKCGAVLAPWKNECHHCAPKSEVDINFASTSTSSQQSINANTIITVHSNEGNT